MSRPYLQHKRNAFRGGDSDPNFSSVVLLLHCNGTDTSTTFTDDSNSAHTPSAVNDAQLDTAEKKFGTASILFDGTSDGVEVADSADWDFGTGDFTMEAFVYPNSGGDTWHGVVIRANGSFDAGDWEWKVEGTDGRLRFRSDGGGNDDSATSAVAYGAWQHIAVARSGTTLKQFVDGTEVSSTTVTDDFTSAKVLGIGKRPSNTSVDWDGWIDEVRITKGVARYTGNFTAPTAEFPNS